MILMTWFLDVPRFFWRGVFSVFFIVLRILFFRILHLLRFCFCCFFAFVAFLLLLFCFCCFCCFSAFAAFLLLLLFCFLCFCLSALCFCCFSALAAVLLSLFVFAFPFVCFLTFGSGVLLVGRCAPPQPPPCATKSALHLRHPRLPRNQYFKVNSPGHKLLTNHICLLCWFSFSLLFLC